MRISRIVAMVFVIVMCTGVAFAKGKKESGMTMPKIGVVVKVGGIPWFNAMEVGIKKRAQELGMDGFMIGPTSNDPALQVRAIEDLIAQKSGRHRCRSQRCKCSRARFEKGARHGHKSDHARIAEPEKLGLEF